MDFQPPENAGDVPMAESEQPRQPSGDSAREMPGKVRLRATAERTPYLQRCFVIAFRDESERHLPPLEEKVKPQTVHHHRLLKVPVPLYALCCYFALPSLTTSSQEPNSPRRSIGYPAEKVRLVTKIPDSVQAELEKSREAVQRQESELQESKETMERQQSEIAKLRADVHDMRESMAAAGGLHNQQIRMFDDVKRVSIMIASQRSRSADIVSLGSAEEESAVFYDHKRSSGKLQSL